MVTSEKEFVLVKQNCVTASVARHRNRQQFIVDSKGRFASNNVFDSQSRRAIVIVHHALTSEPFRKAIMIGNVVAVRQKNGAYATQALHLLYELMREARRRE